MSKIPAPHIAWRDHAKPKDYDAAHEYLALRLNPARAAALVERLRKAPLADRRVNDILRACDRSPLPADDPGVARKLRHAVDGKRFKPAMVASFKDGGADVCQSFHELSAAYALDPFMTVPVFIAYEE